MAFSSSDVRLWRWSAAMVLLTAASRLEWIAEKPDMKKFESERDSWENMLRYRKGEEGFQKWLADLRERSKIEIIGDVAEL